MLRSIGRHIDIVADAIFAAFFSCLLRTGGILMLSDDIGTGIDQCDSALFFGSWIIPGIGPEDFDLYVRVDALRAQGKGIDAADYFGIGNAAT